MLLGAGVVWYLTPPVDFTYYEPTSLPPGMSIQQKRVTVLSPVGSSTRTFSAGQNFRTEDWVYEIYQYRDKGLAIESALQDFDASSVKPTCSFYTSPGRQYYRLCHWVDYGRIGVYEIKFTRGGTRFDVRMPTEVNQKLSLEEINKFVDSFTPKSTFGLPVLVTSGA